MKIMRIFTPSSNFFRGFRLAQQAGYFFLPAKGGFAPINRRPVITERFGSVQPAKVDCLTAVFGGPPSFCPSANVKQSHHAHRNHSPAHRAVLEATQLLLRLATAQTPDLPAP